MGGIPGMLPSVRNLRAVLQSVIFVPFAYAVFFNMIPTFLTAWENSNRLQDRFHDNFRGRQNMYDFIIVGGGAAGSIIANRLSEFHTVLLIEAGGPANPLELIPALSLSLVNQAQTDWSYKTVPQQRACLNSISQECVISAGRSMGGSSTLGWMAWLRGHPMDFDNWAMISGDRSWSYEQLLPHFRKSEEFIGTSTDKNARGREGDLRIRQPDFVGIGQEFVRGGEELGYPSADLNGQHGEGMSILQYPIRRGMRQSTASAFVNPIQMSANLRILQHALVTRILFRDMSNMAYGIEYERFGRTDLAIASREVILACGTFGSSKLLMLSGVGPKAHLEQMGIPVRSDLPVGRNLQDHLAVQLGPFYVNSTKTFLRDRDINPENILMWTVKGRGRLTTTGLQAAGAIASTAARARGEQNWPDILLLMQGQGVHRAYPRDFSRSLNLQMDEMMRYYENAVGRDSFHIQVIAARPAATGQVLLASPNPRDPIIINPRYLEDGGQADIRILAEGILTALRIVEGTLIFNTTLGAQFTRMKLPGCETHTFRSMAYWDCYIRRFTHSIHNPVGTVSLGAVVDATLNVRGTKGLRVVDASIMPTIVSVPTLASTLAIAEKGSAMILQKYRVGNSTGGRGGIGAFIFGRNGLINRNPIQRFLSREFDRLNPLPSLFSIPGNNSNFNPFSRFLGIFRIGGGSGGDASGGVLGSVFTTLNRQTTALFATLLGGRNGGTSPTGNFSGGIGGNPFNIFQQLFPQRNGTGGGLGKGNFNLNSIFGGGGAGRNPFGNGTSPPGGNFGGNFGGGNSNGSNLFDIIFPQRNNSGTLTFPVNPSGGNSSLGGGNPFGGLFALFRPPSGNITRIQLPNPLNDIFNAFKSGAAGVANGGGFIPGSIGSNTSLPDRPLIQLPNPLNDFVQAFKEPARPSQGPPNRNILDALLNPFGNDGGAARHNGGGANRDINTNPLSLILGSGRNRNQTQREIPLSVVPPPKNFVFTATTTTRTTVAPARVTTGSAGIPLVGGSSGSNVNSVLAIPSTIKTTPKPAVTTIRTTVLTTTTAKPTVTTIPTTTTPKPTVPTTTPTTTRPTTTTTKPSTTTTTILTTPPTVTTRATPTTKLTTPPPTTPPVTTRPTLTTTTTIISIRVPATLTTPSVKSIQLGTPTTILLNSNGKIANNIVASATTSEEQDSSNVILPLGLRGRKTYKNQNSPVVEHPHNSVSGRELSRFRSQQRDRGGGGGGRGSATYQQPPVHFHPSRLPYYAQYDDPSTIDVTIPPRPKRKGRKRKKKMRLNSFNVHEYEHLLGNRNYQLDPDEMEEEDYPQEEVQYEY